MAAQSERGTKQWPMGDHILCKEDIEEGSNELHKPYVFECQTSFFPEI
jgi:hypothetical protein